MTAGIKPLHSQKSDQKFWLAFEHANIGMALVLPDGRFQRANPELCRLLGYSEGQLKELDVQTLTHRDDLGEEMSLIQQALKDKITSYRVDKRFMRHDGAVAHTSVSATLDRDHVGNPLHFVYMAHTILEHEPVAPLAPLSPPPPTVPPDEQFESENRLFQFLEAMPIALYVLNGAGMPYYANTPAQELLGIGVNSEAPGDPLAGAHGIYIVGTDQPYPEAQMPVVRALYGDKASVEDMEIKQPDRAIPVRSWGTPVYNGNGDLIFSVGAFSDLSDHVAAQDELVTAHDRYMAICDNVTAFVSVHDAQGTYRFASTVGARITGYEEQEIVGTDARVYIHPDDLPIVGKTYKRYLAGSDEKMRAIYRVLHKSGEYVWVETAARPIIGTYGLHREILCVTHAVALAEGAQMQASLLEEEKDSEENAKELEMRSFLDTLTGIKNRRAVDEQLHKKLTSRRASSYPLGCLLIDIDRFKGVNEKYGHEVADDVLKKVARIIANACRNEDFVGRYGGDEFVVLLPNTDAAGTVVVGEKLISNVRSAYWANTPLTENVTISIGGVCLTRYSGVTEGDLLEMLDSQLNEAKQGGRNRMVMNARRAVSGQ